MKTSALTKPRRGNVCTLRWLCAISTKPVTPPGSFASRGDLDQARLNQLGHADLVRQPVEPGAHDPRSAEPSRLAAVAVEGQVPTEPAPPLAIRLAIPPDVTYHLRYPPASLLATIAQFQ